MNKILKLRNFYYYPIISIFFISASIASVYFNKFKLGIEFSNGFMIDMIVKNSSEADNKTNLDNEDRNCSNLSETIKYNFDELTKKINSNLINSSAYKDYDLANVDMFKTKPSVVVTESENCSYILKFSSFDFIPILNKILLKSKNANDEIDFKDVYNLTNNERVKVVKEVLDSMNIDYEINLFDYVGPQISSQLLLKSVVALIFGLLFVLAYISFKFSFIFGISGIISIMHDIIICLGFISFFQLDLDVILIGALLSIIGYSINNTVILYDKFWSYYNNVNLISSNDSSSNPMNVMLDSVQSIMKRSIITSFVTSLSVFGLFLLPYSSIRNFAFILLCGVFFGLLSSLFLASYLPFLIDFMESIKKFRIKTSDTELEIN